MKSRRKDKCKKKYKGDPNKLGGKLRNYRYRSNLSQLELEVKAGFHNGYISKVENNRIVPKWQTLLKLSKILELSGEEILGLFGLK